MTQPQTSRVTIAPFSARDTLDTIVIFRDAFSADPWFESWDIPAASRRIEEMLDHPGFRGWAAREGASVVGFALGYVGPGFDGADLAVTIVEMAVRADRQNRGIGKRLLAAAEASARDDGYATVEIITSAGRWPCHWYERMGYRTVGTMHEDTVVLARAP